MSAIDAASVEAGRPAYQVEDLFEGASLTGKVHAEHLIAIGVEACLDYETPAANVVPRHGGAMARSISRFRFPAWTIAVSSRVETCQQLQFSSGVCPVHEAEHPERSTDYIRKWVRDSGLEGKVAILTEGPSTKHADANHRMEIIELGR